MAKPALKLFKKKVRRVVIVHRRQTPAALATALELARWLKDRDIAVFSHSTQALKGVAKIERLDKVDLVVALGGDGTYLEAVRLLGGERVPVLGFNMGGLGFLTVHRVAELFEMLELAIKGRLEMKTRTMLRVRVRTGQKFSAEFAALNDLVIERGPSSHLIHISMLVDGLPVTAVKCDGLIIATPTGSTAYNLAAGGPILHPDVDALVVTPICPHSLTSRPQIVPDARPIQFQIEGEDHRAVLTVDGIRCATVGPREQIWVERHSYDHLFLRKVGHNYFNVLKEKLKFGERA